MRTCGIVRPRLLVALFLGVLPIACTQEPVETGKTFVTVNSQRIHYVVAGRGERTLLLIHGYGSGAFTWKGIQDRTPDGFSTYAIDLPGFGYSEKSDEFEYGLPAFADVATEFLAVFHRGPAILVGNSMGGAVSIWAASKYPRQVAAIVPIDSAGVKLENKNLPLIFSVIRLPLIGPLLLSVPGRPLMRNTLEQVYVDDSRITDEVIDTYYRPSRFPGAARAWHKTLADLMQRSDRGEVLDRMEDVTQPVLLLWGAHDTWTSPALLDEFKSRMPQAQSKVYPHLAHVPQEEDSETVAADLFGFAREVFDRRDDSPPGR